MADLTGFAKRAAETGMPSLVSGIVTSTGRVKVPAFDETRDFEAAGAEDLDEGDAVLLGLDENGDAYVIWPSPASTGGGGGTGARWGLHSAGARW